MFTGIVQGTAQVIDCTRREGFMQIELALPAAASENLQVGASIAINGTCLTITSFADNRVKLDVIDTTLALTNLGNIEPGSRVNFERAARIGDEIGGHQMSGHILCTAEITDITTREDNCRIRFATPPEASAYLLPKGYVGLNGCSLTLAEADRECFSVALIPETLRQTTFRDLKVGDRVNLEVDPQTQAIVDTVERYMALHHSTV
ncbi:riboflavin synthase subunit alpha [Marinobacterium weihaiense]|uniref:Riboflavin synthase n=1 Tax=Marinobacterium weihaiense TaxID=2851016 RepID=A0ABS6M7K1_9GAMM|nr:riboflavin synthase subunit alpha [Marinobacterium weihaiense]MBV0932266.1 riboflavin synthase subunit alpha [Marinobacterium weihaiense]